MNLASDRRDSYRVDLTHRGLHLSGATPYTFKDLSAHGPSLLFHGAGHDTPDLPPLELDIGDGDTFRGGFDVVRVRPHAPGVVHLVARWRAMAPEQVHRLSRFIAREFKQRRSDPSRLFGGARALTVNNTVFIRNLLTQRSEGSMRHMSIIDGNRNLSTQLAVEEVVFQGGRRVIRGRLLGEPVTLAGDRPYKFVLRAPMAVNLFESHVLQQDDDLVTLAMPAEVQQTGYREARIDVAGGAAAGIRVGFAHPRLGGAAGHQPVLGISQRGLSFVVSSNEHGLFPGDRLPDLCIELPGQSLAAIGVVRSIAERERPAGFSCGIELEFNQPAGAEAWRRFVFDRMHPNTTDARGHADRAWRVLEASNYVGLWTAPETRAQVRAEYIGSWQQPAPEVGQSLLLDRGKSCVGVIAGSLIYPRSWVLHHLARDGRDDGQSQAPLKEAWELISGIVERLKTETDFEHFLIYIERGKRFNERLYSDFAERYFDKSKLTIGPIEVWRRATATALPPAEHPEADIVDATPALLARLADRLATTTLPLEREALALDQARIDLRDFTAFCGARAHERRREICFALEAGQPGAALIVETGGEGVNIFGLLNTCRVVSLGETPPSEAIREALLRRAIEVYRAAGKQHFLLFEATANPPETTATTPARLGFEHVSGGLRWIAHRDVIPAWTAYLDGLMTSATSAN